MTGFILFNYYYYYYVNTPLTSIEALNQLKTLIGLFTTSIVCISGIPNICLLLTKTQISTYMHCFWFL